MRSASPAVAERFCRVFLAPEEMVKAEAKGRKRQARRMADGHQNAYGSMGGDEDHVQGVRGEAAFAKFHGLPYDLDGDTDIDKDEDVCGFQVRSRRLHHYEIYLWEKDSPDAWYSLMTGEGPEFRYHGSIHGTQAKDVYYWTLANPVFPRHDCFVIPTPKLQLMYFGGEE